MNCFPLSENTYSVDNSKKFIPFDPDVDSVIERPASLIVDICPFLIKTDTDLLVLDTGLGYKLSDGEFNVYSNIRKYGFEPEQVTKVLLSHLHKDHFGGGCYEDATGFHLMFPNATYYVQEGELKNALGKNSSSYELSKVQFLSGQKQLQLLNGKGNINPNIYYELCGGHTEFHQVFLVETNEEKYFYGGDVVPQGPQLQRKFVAKYDFDGKRSAELRLEYGHKAAKENWICLFFHSTSLPMAKVKEIEGRFELIKV